MFEINKVGPYLHITGNCIETGKPYSVRVLEEQWDNWQAGELIQRAMPELSADDREFLISSISPEGWERMFGCTFS